MYKNKDFGFCILCYTLSNGEALLTRYLRYSDTLLGGCYIASEYRSHFELERLCNLCKERANTDNLIKTIGRRVFIEHAELDHVFSKQMTSIKQEWPDGHIVKKRVPRHQLMSYAKKRAPPSC